jgi:hypothetical protein
VVLERIGRIYALVMRPQVGSPHWGDIQSTTQSEAPASSPGCRGLFLSAASVGGLVLGLIGCWQAGALSFFSQISDMPPARYIGPPMTLANMRENGVRSLSVTCHLCHHAAVISADRFEDAISIPAFSSRVICTGCGAIGADVRPNCAERSLTGRQWQ